MSDTHSMQATGAVESTNAAANALPGGEARGFGACTLKDGCPAFVGTGSTFQRCGHGFGLHSDFAAASAPTEATTEPTNALVDSAATGPGQKHGFGACTMFDGCPAFVGTGSTCQRCGHGFGSSYAADTGRLKGGWACVPHRMCSEVNGSKLKFDSEDFSTWYQKFRFIGGVFENPTSIVDMIDSYLDPTNGGPDFILIAETEKEVRKAFSACEKVIPLTTIPEVIMGHGGLHDYVLEGVSAAGFPTHQGTTCTVPARSILHNIQLIIKFHENYLIRTNPVERPFFATNNGYVWESTVAPV
ncbi:hypothetical protein B0H13DRAFT_1890635 [Mycena leptocephala]|nr:hypothetical protein B0H13DRAFT_1890635 [Mycena leptocephala]